jgi:YidC/Oxa1 family membrane protein insertase
MSDIKNLLLTIFLSTLILFGWQYYFGSKVIPGNINQNATNVNMAENQDVLNEIEDREKAISLTERITIDSDKLHGSISLKGARFDDLTLADYHATQEPKSKEVVLLSPSNTPESYFAEFGFICSNNNNCPNNSTIWKASKNTLKNSDKVELSWNNGQGLEFFINIELDDNYMFKIIRSVKNTGNSSKIVTPYGLINQAYATAASKPFMILHEGPIGVMEGILQEISYKDMREKHKQEFNKPIDWIGITDKYWLTAIIPEKGKHYNANFSAQNGKKKDKFQVDIVDEKYEVHPGGVITTTNYFFAGAKEVSLLDQYANLHQITLFDRAVDFGWFYFLTKPMFSALKYFYSLTGNFGVAILILTVLVKLILFPLAHKSYKALARMKDLQPEINRLRETYKDDKMQLNKAVMELYQKEKVNPLAGCLPLLIQIPVFFSLYKVLFVTIEMRHAPFFGWIRDLSVPDPTTIFNMFGLFSWQPPTFLMIGVWPIIMGVTMYFQQKMNPEPSDPVQAKVMKFLPVLFVFMFNTFPAGLVIYWAWNNILSILQQLIISKSSA